MASWLRLWHDMPNDPKWRTIARASGQPIAAVIAVYVHLLVNASANATERGRTQRTQTEHIASALDLKVEEIDEILAAMQGRVLDGDMISGWEKRQPLREDGAAERAKHWREAKKLEREEQAERNRTQPNAEERPDTETETDAEVIDLAPTVHSRLASPKRPPVPVAEIVELYGRILPMCPAVLKMTPARRKQIEARWRCGDLPDLDTWRSYFEFCAESKFLTGLATPMNGRKRFVADLEWLTRESNYAKIYEGKYHG